MEEKLTYKNAGVDIDEGNRAVAMIKDSVRATYRPEVLGTLGGFGGLFALDAKKYDEPVLVSGADGVGTKLKIAFMLDRHDTIGRDAVAMCVNDILAQGAEPLFFLDYIAAGKIEAEKISQIVDGVAAACKESGCALIGGETAEMAGFYADNEYDVAGFAVGIADKKKIITGETIEEGDVILGLPSTGLHSNGYSLARKIIFERKKMSGTERIDPLGKTIGEELLTPTKLYTKICLPLFEKFVVNGMAHITGGGLYENISRILPAGTAANINADSWDVPDIFRMLKEWGDINAEEMYRTFNNGIGMAIIAGPIEAAKIRAHLAANGENCFQIGRIAKGNREVTIKGGFFDA